MFRSGQPLCVASIFLVRSEKKKKRNFCKRIELLTRRGTGLEVEMRRIECPRICSRSGLEGNRQRRQGCEISKKKRKREKKRNKEKTDERIRREKERDVCPRDAGPPHFLAIGSQFGKEDEGRTGGRERQTRLF